MPQRKVGISRAKHALSPAEGTQKPQKERSIPDLASGRENGNVVLPGLLRKRIHHRGAARIHIVVDSETSSTTWHTPPADISLSEGAVDVWLISLAQPSDVDESFAGVLSSAERERAARFKFDKHRRPFVVAHAALRLILSQYLNTAPLDLTFVSGINGKPSLAPELSGSGLQFNLSHSHEMALLGVTRGHEIGIDIEWIKEDYGFDEVAERFFTAKEVSELRALPAHLQRQAFFKCWTSKEAFLKAKGTGLSGKLDQVKITLSDEQQVRIGASVPGWTLSELTPGNGYEAAVVVEGGSLPVNCYRWEPAPAR